MDLFENIVTASGDWNPSDIHIVAGYRPFIRVNGEIQELRQLDQVTSEQVHQVLEELLKRHSSSQHASEVLRQRFGNRRSIVFSTAVEGDRRFRVSAMQQQDDAALAIRPIPAQIPTPEMLNLPHTIYELCEREQGLLLVAGPRGNGKTTTLAVIIDLINRNQKTNIITIESPIEFRHESILSYIQQCEVEDVQVSSARTIEAAVQQNPDIIMISDLTDVQTTEAALAAAEAGVLVLASITAGSAIQTLKKILSMYPVQEHARINSRLAAVLEAVICQRLVPSLEVNRMLVTEILKTNYSVKQFIEEGNYTGLYSIMENARSEGMHLLSQNLITMIKDQKISFQTAIKYCQDKKYYEKLAQELLREL